MSEPNFPSALARLLKDPQLRAQFAADPGATVQALGLAGPDAATLAALSSAALEHQAHMLLRKRFEALRRHVPLTLTHLNAEAWERFTEYAIGQWPEGHRRHLIDALSFCRWLAERGLAFEPCERNALRFALSRWPLKLYLVWRLAVDGPRRPALQLFYRTARSTGEWRFYTAF